MARVLEFFAGADREREDAGGVRAGRRAIPRVVRGARSRAARRLPAPRGRLHPNAPGGPVPTVKQHLAAIRMLGDWLVVS